MYRATTRRVSVGFACGTLKVGVSTKEKWSPSKKTCTPNWSKVWSFSKRGRGKVPLERSRAPLRYVIRLSQVKCSEWTRSCRAFQSAKMRSSTAFSWGDSGGSAACADGLGRGASARTAMAATAMNRRLARTSMKAAPAHFACGFLGACMGGGLRKPIIRR
jgi:hypothetical protein